MKVNDYRQLVAEKDKTIQVLKDSQNDANEVSLKFDWSSVDKCYSCCVEDVSRNELFFSTKQYFSSLNFLSSRFDCLLHFLSLAEYT